MTTPSTIDEVDVRLVARLKQRDHDALKDLVRLHGSKIYGVAMSYMHDERASQEVMQDALINIWQKIGSFEGRSAFTSWIYRVTANVALMALRRQRRQARDVSLDATHEDDAPAWEATDPGPLPSAALLGQELNDRVQAEIERLPEPYRLTFRLRDVEEMSIEEVAALTGASVPAVKTRLHRARLRLRQRLLPVLRSRGTT